MGLLLPALLPLGFCYMRSAPLWRRRRLPLEVIPPDLHLQSGLRPPGRPPHHRERFGSIFREPGWPFRLPRGPVRIYGTELSGLLIPLRLWAPNGSKDVGPPQGGSPGIGLGSRLRGRMRIGFRDIGAQGTIGFLATGNDTRQLSGGGFSSSKPGRTPPSMNRSTP